MSVWNKQITANMTATIRLDLILAVVILVFKFLTQMEELVMVSSTQKISLTIILFTIVIFQTLTSAVMVPTTVNKYATTHMEHTTVSAVTVMNLKVMDFHVQVQKPVPYV